MFGMKAVKKEIASLWAALGCRREERATAEQLMQNQIENLRSMLQRQMTCDHNWVYNGPESLPKYGGIDSSWFNLGFCFRCNLCELKKTVKKKDLSDKDRRGLISLGLLKPKGE